MGLTPASVMLAEPAPAWVQAWRDLADGFDLRKAEPELIAQARLVLLDCIGAIAAGMQEPEVRRLAARLARNPGAGIAVGAGLRLHGGDAAFLNGVAGTMLELDEGNSFARGHPGIHVLPALLSGIGGAEVDGMAFLRAFVLGYEAGARTGAASRLRPAIHPHGTWGTIGAAVAAAALEGATGPEVVETMNVSASISVASSLRAMLEGATVRNAYAGVAARSGLYAWDLVASGFTGETDALRSVYSGVLSETFAPAVMTEELGNRWEIRRNYFKRHAACRFTHGALDVIANLIAQHGPFDPAEIARIEVESYAMAAQLDAPEPPTMLAAKFSVPFAVATMLVHGAANVPAFRSPALEDETVRALAARVQVVEDPEMTAMLPDHRPARVRMTLSDGRQFEGQTQTNRGDAADPYSDEEIREKFHELAAPVWGDAHATVVARAVDALDDAASLASLCAALAEPPKE